MKSLNVSKFELLTFYDFFGVFLSVSQRNLLNFTYLGGHLYRF